MTTAIRRRPAVTKVIDYWRETAGEIFPDIHAAAIGWGEPFCFRCGWLAPLPEKWDKDPWAVVGGWLELAHLQNHGAGGPDDETNIVPLCPLCHHAMPDFTDGPDQAVAWVRSSQPTSHQSWWQSATDARWGGDEFEPYPGWKRFFGFFVYAGEVVQRHRVAQSGVAA